jgi:hypothetical protein
MKKVYPMHNLTMGGPNRGMPKDFNKDSEWRLGEMQKKN